MLVIDASVALAWVLPDEHSDRAEAVLGRVVSEGAIVPAIWPLEVANALLVGEIRGRITSDQVTQAVAVLRELPIDVAPLSAGRAFGAILALARAHRLTAYDAAYLDLAMGQGLPLASLDDPMCAAAVATGVEVVE
jgi:predicted nucleic acid-binding protein